MSATKSSRSNGANAQSLAQFDRGSVNLLRQFPPLNNKSNVSLQLLFFALLEVLSLHLTNNDPLKSRLLFQLQLHFFQISGILPTSMSLAAGSIRQLDLFENYVRILRESVQTALSVVQRPASDKSTITSLLEKEFQTVRLPNNNPAPINIDIPLKFPVLLSSNAPVMINDFDNIVVYRYVQDFYELGKLGKGAFGSVFQARNHLDDRLYAMKKIVFDENNDRTRYQAKCALREVRVLASLTHPNIVQYHCAWLELVPVQSRNTTTTPSPPTTMRRLPEIKALDSLDEMIKFEGTENQSPLDDEEEEEEEESSSGKLSNLEQYHSDGVQTGASASKVSFQQSMSSSEVEFPSKTSNKQLIPLHCRNQNIHPFTRNNFIDAKIVLFIQMQLCDTTLHDWLRHRDQIIVDECNQLEPKADYRLNDLGQRQSWKIFHQLLSAVEYLHSRSFVHRDIKPRNIFLSYDATDRSSVHVKLGDFGLATLSDSEATPELPEQWQHDGSAGVGTALYAPPEQLNSRQCLVTDKSDIYSLGIVLFESFNIFFTDAERLNCLSSLRVRGEVEPSFADLYPFERRLIEQAVSSSPTDRPSVTQMLADYKNEYSKRSTVVTKQTIIEQLRATLRDREQRIEQLELQLKETSP